MHADSALLIEDGKITIAKSYEGLEGVTVTIAGGTIDIIASDDGINSAGGSDTLLEGRPGQNSFSESGSYSINISGGWITISADGDGLDSNGTLYVSGGTILVNGPTSDANGALDSMGTTEITGGVVAAAGSSGMAVGFDETSSQCSLMIGFTSAQTAGTAVTVCDASGNVILSFTPIKPSAALFFSSPKLVEGETYTVYTGGMVSGTGTDALYTDGTLSGSSTYTTVTLSGSSTTVGTVGTMGGARPVAAKCGRDGRRKIEIKEKCG